MGTTINAASARAKSPPVIRPSYERNSVNDSIIRGLDIIISSLAILIIFPVIMLISILILIFDPGPVFFAHNRVGRGSRMFPCLKFRTMVTDSAARLEAALAADPELRDEWSRTQKLKNDPRITLIGSFLRKSSLDEVPQLLNVLRGEMSLVGPRPIVPAEIRHYGRYFHEYCSVRPGITGLWQISGRSDTSYRRRVAFDVKYVRTRSLPGNISILLKTVPAVVMTKGSY